MFQASGHNMLSIRRFDRQRNHNELPGYHHQHSQAFGTLEDQLWQALDICLIYSLQFLLQFIPRRRSLCLSVDCWSVCWVPTSIEPSRWKWGIPWGNRRSSDPATCQPSDEQEYWDKRRLFGDFMHHFRSKNIFESQNCFSEKMHSKTDWNDCYWGLDSKWREDLEACRVDPGQLELGTVKQAFDCTLRARACSDRLIWRENLQDNIRDSRWSGLLLSKRKMI